MTEYIIKENVVYLLAKRETIDSQPRAIRRARNIVDSFPSIAVASHGRLIDAETLKERLQQHADLFKGSNVLEDKIQRDAFLTAISEVVNEPTVIPARNN